MERGSKRLSTIGLALPGASVGAAAGPFAGMLALFSGQPPGWAATVTITLSLPMALLGAGYSLALAHRLFRPGVFAPAAAYWVVGFPLGRLIHEVTHRLLLTGRPGVPGGPGAFLLFEALVSVGFAIGFVWAHERIMPRWLLRLRGRDPRVDRLLTDYLRLAERTERPEAAHRRSVPRASTQD